MEVGDWEYENERIDELVSENTPFTLKYTLKSGLMVLYFIILAIGLILLLIGRVFISSPIIIIPILILILLEVRKRDYGITIDPEQIVMRAKHTVVLPYRSLKAYRFGINQIHHIKTRDMAYYVTLIANNGNKYGFLTERFVIDDGAALDGIDMFNQLLLMDLYLTKAGIPRDEDEKNVGYMV